MLGRRAWWEWASLAAVFGSAVVVLAFGLDRGDRDAATAPASDWAASGSSVEREGAAQDGFSDVARRQRLLWALLAHEIGGRTLTPLR